MLYFDHNATTPMDGRVLEAMLPYLKNVYGNPSSLYRFARIARTAIDTAREQLAALVDAEPGQIVFTSGGTEANAQALANAGDAGLFISAIEHPSVAENAKARQMPLTVLPVTTSGRLDPQCLEQFGFRAGDFVSLMLANNETGALQDVATVAEHLAGRGVILHTDAVQALGKISLSFRKLGVQLMSLSSHKIYGPKGCGALVRSRDFPLKTLIHGGSQEQGYRAGTENVAAIVGFGKAAELANSEFQQRNAGMRALRERLEQQLLAMPGVVIFARQTERLPNTLQFGIAGVKGEMLLMQLDRRDIAVSSGSACAASSPESSPVLAAMAVEPALAGSAIRISLGKDNTEQEVDQFVSVMKTLLAIH
ncbi:MAG: cysteine desulfurase family protein [Methylococcales bacterium]|nr:cysteine desulfurase family protein [Methylococcales bacterium]